ncbi:MAG: thiamine pyrophosphate-dependent enzyme, partial [Thermodesulfobacteriota bacterium]
YPVIEMQLGMRDRLQGRLKGLVPPQGELIPDVLAEVISSFLKKPIAKPKYAAGKMRRPTLCPGCPHRAAFYAIRQTFPQGIYPSDIGCYTLGLNLQAVDTVLCMGAAISQAAGFYFAQQMKGEISPIIATIGDSTFYHAGIPALIDAVHQKAQFILVILDNSTTAMTGNQPTLSAERLADGRLATAVKIEDIVQASGVKHLQIVDPYHLEEMTAALKNAASFTREKGGVAVIISRHPCLLLPGAKPSPGESLEISADCVGCAICLHDLECPAIVKNAATGLPEIDQNLCVGCGVCLQVCPSGAIRRKE